MTRRSTGLDYSSSSAEPVASACEGQDVGPASVRVGRLPQVNGVWYPVKQAFEVAVGVPRSEFISHTARRHLATLGFPLQGKIESRDEAAAATATAKPDLTIVRDFGGAEWHTEANVQASVVTALTARGYRVLSVANTATEEHGIDVISSRDGAPVGVEGKGTTRAGTTPTQPGPANAPRGGA